MPSSDTSHLAETLVCLPGQLLGSPTGHHTLESLTLGGSDDIDLLVLCEHSLYRDLLLEVVDHEVDLVGGSCSSVDLNLSNVSLLLSNVHSAHLGVNDGANNLGVLLEFGQFVVDGGFVGGVLLGVVGECLLLGSVPSLVESATGLLADVLGPNGTDGTETLGSLNVSNNTDDDEGRSLDDGDALNDFLLVHLGSDLLQVTDYVGHTSLVPEESSQVGLLGGVILGESPHSSSVVRSPLSGEETQGAMSGGFKFSVRHP